jgi:hypothetical protein
MTDDFQLDARKWRWLNNPARYIERDETGGLKLAPLERQFKTAKEILSRFSDGRGVLLADDVGLGKTTVAALVAWVVACQGKRVRIYAPNEVLGRRWAEELKRHVPMLKPIGASGSCIKHGDAKKLNAGRIQVTTHHALVKSHDKNEQRTTCDLIIIDEAHRAKGENSAFNQALRNLGDRAKRKLILTATPFSIQIAELEQLLRFVGATELEAVRRYADDLRRLYELGDGHDVIVEAARLVDAAKAAIDEIGPYLIRYGVDGLSKSEQKHFGTTERWDIPTAPASPDEIKLLLRMDRLLQLTPERKGERRNDPRFHVGWQHVGVMLDRAADRVRNDANHAVIMRHITEARQSLQARCAAPHPKIAAVSQAIRPLLDAGEKVLVFCHHRATASELLGALERSLRIDDILRNGPPEDVWRAAWESVLLDNDGAPRLVTPVIDWFCTPGLRWQVGQWLGEPASTAKALANQFRKIRPRNTRARDVPTICQAALSFTKTILNPQSRSTYRLLNNIANAQHVFGRTSHLPGKLDEGFRVMGAWIPDARGAQPKTLYTATPDIVLALFNSPFGPDVLVTTDYLSEGVNLHGNCRHLIHYELDPSPMRTLQRNGRVRRVDSWAALTSQPIRYAYPTFGGTRDEKAVGIMEQRIAVFGVLLGGVPVLEDEPGDNDRFAEQVLGYARKDLRLLNRKLRA